VKAVITAAGKGTRSGLDGKFRKEMLPIYDHRNGRLVLRPIIDRIIYDLESSGIREVAAVLSLDDLITKNYLQREFPYVTIIHQAKQNGFGDAVRSAAEFVGGERFLLFAGDGILLNLRTFLPGFAEGSGENRLVLMEVADPSKYGVAVVRRINGRILVEDVEEKPSKPRSNLALAAMYILGHKVMDCLLDMAGENIELTPAISESIRTGNETEAVIVDQSMWISVGKAETYHEILKRSLDFALKRESERSS